LRGEWANKNNVSRAKRREGGVPRLTSPKVRLGRGKKAQNLGLDASWPKSTKEATDTPKPGK